jgi:hypothetical protein
MPTLKNTDKYPQATKKEKIFLPFDRPSTTFVIEGVFNKGPSCIKKKVVVMARSEYDAKRFARQQLEKHSDDCFKIDIVRKMTENDVIVEVM